MATYFKGSISRLFLDDGFQPNHFIWHSNGRSSTVAPSIYMPVPVPFLMFSWYLIGARVPQRGQFDSG